MYQYQGYLEQAGLAVKDAPFFDAAYLQQSYAGQSKARSTWRAFSRRRSQLRSGSRNNLLWIEKEALPFMPWAVERAFLPGGVPFVADYDDAIFHRYNLHDRTIVRRLLGAKIGAVMAASHTVFAGNSYLAAHARAAGAKRIEIVPTVVDTDVYRLKTGAPADGPPRIGWIGSPSTWTEFGQPLVALVQKALKPAGGLFRVVGGGPASYGLDGVEALEWSEVEEVDLIRGMDIGIMPLSDTPWARGKCGYKLIQYMACGLPVIASPVGVNAEIVAHGETGFLATTPEEWRAFLTLLLSDPVLCREMGARGRARVEAEYSLQVWGPRVATLLKEAAL
jgi:glycosyltransferase involved in cell wall biosynthesis